MRPVYKILGSRRNPNGTVDVRIQQILLNRPTPEWAQRKARLRRLRQQLRDGVITQEEHDASVEQVEKDHKKWRKMAW